MMMIIMLNEEVVVSVQEFKTIERGLVLTLWIDGI